jgi:hypothetical protein
MGALVAYIPCAVWTIIVDDIGRGPNLYRATVVAVLAKRLRVRNGIVCVNLFVFPFEL